MRGWIQQRFWPVAKETWSGWSKHDGSLLSAATAYYAAFSLFPLCVVLIAVLGVVGRYSAFLQSQQAELVEVIKSNMGPWLAEPGRWDSRRRAGAGGRERAAGAADSDRRGHRHLHATGEHVRPHLGYARGEAADLAGRDPRGPVGPIAGIPDVVGHWGVVVRVVPGRRRALERAFLAGPLADRAVRLARGAVAGERGRVGIVARRCTRCCPKPACRGNTRCVAGCWPRWPGPWDNTCC